MFIVTPMLTNFSEVMENRSEFYGSGLNDPRNALVWIVIMQVSFGFVVFYLFFLDLNNFI